MPIPSSETLWLRDVPIRANNADALKSIGTRWLQYALHTAEAHGSISPYFFCKLELLLSCHVARSTITAWCESKAQPRHQRLKSYQPCRPHGALQGLASRYANVAI
jgi:hypothetical protein